MRSASRSGSSACAEGRVVLDQDAANLTRDEAMAVYGGPRAAAEAQEADAAEVPVGTAHGSPLAVDPTTGLLRSTVAVPSSASERARPQRSPVGAK